MKEDRAISARTAQIMSSPNRPFPHETWTIVSSHTVLHTPHLHLRSDTVRLPDGNIVENYFVQESRGYSVIFALTAEGEIVLVRQYKHGLGKVILELPAGGIDPGEEPSHCAARELAEETGYVGDAPEFIASFATNPTGSNGRFYLYLIRNAKRTQEQHLDSTEQIEVVITDLATLLAHVREGGIDVNTHITSILFILDQARQGKLSLSPAVVPE
jgi:ADP-ribose pyrophosphatase